MTTKCDQCGEQNPADTHTCAPVRLQCNHQWFSTGAMAPSECRCIQCGTWGKLISNTVQVTREQLAELYPPPAAPVQERCKYCDGTGDVHDKTGEWRGNCHCVNAAQPAVPLTKEQVRDLCKSAGYGMTSMQARADFINGIRHGESAHGITEKGSAT